MIPREDGFEIFIYYANTVLFDDAAAAFYFYLLVCPFPLFHSALHRSVLFRFRIPIAFRFNIAAIR